MNNGIKNKLKELMGEKVRVIHDNNGIIIIHSPKQLLDLYKVLRFEGEDCVVLGNNLTEKTINIDHVSLVSIDK